MNVEEKLQHIENSGLEIAYDGCHKLYVLDTVPEATREAEDIGYYLYPASEIRSLINRSCGLVFVNRWALDIEGNTGFKTEWTIEQGELDEAGYFSDEDDAEEEWIEG